MSKFIVWLVTCFLSTLGFSYFYYKISKSQQKINLAIVVVFIMGVLISTFSRYYNFLLFNSISYFIYYPILFYLLNHMSFRELFFYVIIVWLYGMVLDLLSMIAISGLYNLFNLNVDNIEIFQGFPTIIVFILLILISKNKFIDKITKYLYNLYSKIEYLDFALVSFTVLIFILGLSIAVNIKKLSITFLLIVIIYLMLLCFILIVKYKSNNYENKIFLKTLKENNEFYISMDAENRIFKHNLAAKLLSIKSVSNKKARSLIDDMLSQYNKNIDFSRHVQDIPYGFNGIIYQKLYPYLDKLNVKIDIQIDFDIFEVLKPKRYNVFVEKMVVSLDNAIESCLNSYDKLLILNLYSIDDLIVIEIKNTFSSNLNIDELGMVNYSTKGKKRGLGLFSALRDKEAAMNVKIINNFFVTKISAKKNNLD